MPSRKELANAIRALSMDAVEKAGCGHPGAPMGMADIAEVLWNDFLTHNPSNPAWPDRDRFVMSNGHGSMLVYALLHLTGYDLTMEDIKNFRQLHSKTPGHPERGYTPGIETTTGPLGQGIANAVGMAIAERTLEAQFNRGGHTVVGHYTYVFLGDGCMMEGISHEVCSLAGTLGLNKLVAFYDDNGISIDGEVKGWFTDDTAQRFEAYGWHVIRDVDGHDSQAVMTAIERARDETVRPSLICCKTIIGWGAPNAQGTEKCHGARLGKDEVGLARETIGWAYPPFEIPGELYQKWDATEQGAKAELEWNERFEAYRAEYPELAAEFKRRLAGKMPANWNEYARAYITTTNKAAAYIASRNASQNAVNYFAPVLPELMGGSADLAVSNLTLWSGSRDVNAGDHSGNYIYYGVREFGMSAMMNGIVLHGGFIPYGGTFLTFSDYARNALRMAALMKAACIYVYTHDSIGLGEDGPTHQPVEHIASLRIIPNMEVWRPCDATETAAAWKAAIERRDGPTSLILSRQKLKSQNRTAEQIDNISRGGYILFDCPGTPEAIFIATGSEVEIAMDAAAILSNKGRNIRVVSMPCTSIFDNQDPAYRSSVLPGEVTSRVSIEAGITSYWHRYVGLSGITIGVDRFGESAPYEELFKEFNLTKEAVVESVLAIL